MTDDKEPIAPPSVLEAAESFLLQWRTEKHLPIHGRTQRKLLDLKDAVDRAKGKENTPPREWRK